MFSFTEPSQINGMKITEKIIPAHIAPFPFVDCAVLISNFRRVYFLKTGIIW